MQYAVIFEKCKHNYSAYVPDLPGCIAIGETLQETRERITEAIEFYIKALQESGYPVPSRLTHNQSVNPKDDKDNQ